ncbi:hypothetical protein CY652_01450 [Burkholderia sp. WAC0059]|uniref:tetratricopeptide repeat protein n=1 Tax=Burkholderia sp. WAC0059 TaxID=2066022 RepID=UPI000C7EEBCE|nr:tetratricopeptide repeat protein [Burkholderia sp. WAC0059]PLZ04363.1 hypothetical protein CY652_01450 [Burkholderia sp. WAC0059]
MSLDQLLKLGAEHQNAGRLDLAETHYRQALGVSPGHREAYIGLSLVLIRTNRYDDAIGYLSRLLKNGDDTVVVHRQLGLAHAGAGRLKPALEHFLRVLALEPDDPPTLHVVANLQQALGMREQASATFRRAVEKRQIVVVPAAVSPPDFRALFVFAPGAGNTPVTFLVEKARFETNVVNMLHDFDYDLEQLRASADVVVNLISDVDQSQALLEPAQALVERIGKPALNPPKLVAETSRDAVARRLAGTPGCIVPQTHFYQAAELRDRVSENAGHDALPIPFPLLVRPAGTHGGDNFEKMESTAELARFLAKHDLPGFYLTSFVDYRSADGYFRKYRFFYVNGEILPYHLAIDEKWKIHHNTTPMADIAWMQDEEKTFLEEPWSVFGESQREALRAIRDTIGLDYFGIDCGLDREGAIVVFEVNASMLAHGNNSRFPYKTEAVERIRQAFHALLERTALGARAANPPAG